MREWLARAELRPDELRNEVAVVTGSGRGIGRTTAIALALLGARVVVAERSDEGAETERLIRESGGEALFVPTDVSLPGDISRLVSTVQQRWGAATILINNAILCPVARVEEIDPDLWDRVMAVNLRGAFLAVKGFLPGMREADRGTIVNLVSTDAMPGLSAYIASKQGLTGLTQSLAAELAGTPIRAIAFSPGLVDTPGLRSAGTNLAPLLGMQAEQFFRLSLHPAYEGPMPAGHAGVAAAYLVARLADEYHGEVVTGYAVLERAGLLTPGGETPAAAATAEAPRTTRTTAPSPPTSPAMEPGPVNREEALRLCTRLEGILAETAADFERLPFFVRPLARAGFKAKAGQSLPDWQRTAARLRAQLERGEPIDGATLRPMLAQLIDYVQGVPAQTARFTKDQQLLRQVSERMAGYQAVLRALLEAIGGRLS